MFYISFKQLLCLCIIQLFKKLEFGQILSFIKLQIDSRIEICLIYCHCILFGYTTHPGQRLFPPSLFSPPPRRPICVGQDHKKTWQWSHQCFFMVSTRENVCTVCGWVLYVACVWVCVCVSLFSIVCVCVCTMFVYRVCVCVMSMVCVQCVCMLFLRLFYIIWCYCNADLVTFRTFGFTACTVHYSYMFLVFLVCVCVCVAVYMWFRSIL